MKARVESIKIVCIHPIYNTYPIATFGFGKTKIKYSMFYDHDIFEGEMGDFKIYDHTNFPNTLDPTRVYQKEEKMMY